MSISLIEKKSLIQKQIPISSQFLSTTILKKIVSNELSCSSSQLKLFHFQSDQEYKQNEIIKRGDKIYYLLASQNENSNYTNDKKKGIIYPQELQKMIQNSKVILIKSSNQQNIQKSKDQSLWATTFSNQERLKYFYQNSQNVILLFATNRSYEIKGIARMDSQPDRVPDKTVWSGVTNIRLGGNFKIRWLRKKPLSLVSVQKALGTNFKDTIIKACDGQQLDPQSCKKLAFLFQTPQEPFYQNQNKIQSSIKKYQGKIKNQPFLSTQFNMLQYPFNQNQFQMNPPIFKDQQKLKEQKNDDSHLSQQLSSQRSNKNKKIKKKNHKKQKKAKKHKKSKKSHRKYSDSSEQFQSQKSNQSSPSEDQKKKSKKEKKRKKQKKSKKYRS